MLVIIGIADISTEESLTKGIKVICPNIKSNVKNKSCKQHFCRILY